MKTLHSITNRRDRCYLFGRRASRLNSAQATAAWRQLATAFEDMGNFDVPKFNDVLAAYRTATKIGRKKR